MCLLRSVWSRSSRILCAFSPSPVNWRLYYISYKCCGRTPLPFDRDPVRLFPFHPFLFSLNRTRIEYCPYTNYDKFSSLPFFSFFLSPFLWVSVPYFFRICFSEVVFLLTLRVPFTFSLFVDNKDFPFPFSTDFLFNSLDPCQSTQKFHFFNLLPMINLYICFST